MADLGLDVVFGIMGDANLFVVDSYVRCGGGTFVAVCHEGAAMAMASGYACASGRVGAATVTHGPGLSNITTPLFDAVRSSTPVVVVAGDTARLDKQNLQNIPQRELVLATGAGFEDARAPETVLDDLAVAVRRAEVERRPVVLNLPKDFQWLECDYTTVRRKPIHRPAATPDEDALDRAVGIIASAKRPVVLAGRGAAAPGARDALVRLADRVGAPLATTLKGKDLFAGHRFALGIFGGLSTPVGLSAIVDSDCIIAFGAAMNHLTTDRGDLLRDKQVVQVDLHQGAIGRHHPVNAGIVGDTVAVASAIVDLLDEAEIPATGFASEALAGRLAGFSHAEFDRRSTAPGTVDARDFYLAFEQALPTERSLITDSGRFMTEAVKILSVPEPTAYVHTGNVGSIGLGFGNALGVSYAAPDRPAVLVTGDGGFMMGGLAEFSTAVRYGRDLVVAVMNDRSYGAEHIQFRSRDMDPSLTVFDWPSLATVAEAMGGTGVTIASDEDLGRLPDVLSKRQGPLLLDVRLDPDVMPTPAPY
jgi:thiamine pyrophosphate-dependent acetolactate synthase large subunit-like protein